MKAAALLAAALVLGAAIRALIGWLMGEPQPARDGWLYSSPRDEGCTPDRSEWTHVPSYREQWQPIAAIDPADFITLRSAPEPPIVSRVFGPGSTPGGDA